MAKKITKEARAAAKKNLLPKPINNIVIWKITDSLEEDSIVWHFKHTYLGRDRKAQLKRSKIFDKNYVFESLSGAGYNVSNVDFTKLIQNLLTQEANPAHYSIDVVLQFSELGWVAFENSDGTKQLCYRCNELIGSSVKSEYVGPYNVEPHGTFEAWRNMVENEVIGNIQMEICLLTGLTAVITGILAYELPVENAVISICGNSGSGKSSGGYLSCSTTAKPFSGAESSNRGELKSLYQSWCSTEAAVTSSQAGNKGAVSIFNELGTYEGKNMKSIVYGFSEGVSKLRLNANMKAYVLSGYQTTFVSIGEKSIFNLIRDKSGGIQTRILEMDVSDSLTTSAANANAIKEGCIKNNSFAAPMLAQYIIDSGAEKFVADVYNSWKAKLNSMFNKKKHTERFVEKFAALFLCSAQLGEKALGIKFSTDAIIEYFSKYNDAHADLDKSEATSYAEVLRLFRDNKKNFMGTTEYRAGGETWGYVKNKGKIHKKSGRYVTKEITLRKDVLERELSKAGFDNVKSCAKIWKEQDVLNYEKDRNTRSRTIDKDVGEELVYVFYIYGKKPESNLVKKAGKQIEK